MRLLKDGDLDPTPRQLIERALLIISLKYGQNSQKPLAYHNQNHARKVIEAARVLADLALKRKKISLDEKKLLLIAAAYHDIEQKAGSGKNEEASANLCLKHMTEKGYSHNDRQRVKEMIMATQVIYKNGKMHQSATSDYLSQILADADLASLGRPTKEYWKNAMALFNELYLGSTTSNSSYKEFIKNQPTFLIHHKFYTEEAEELFPHKSENITYLNDLLKVNSQVYSKPHSR